MKKPTVKFSDLFNAIQLEMVAPGASLRSSGHKIYNFTVAEGNLAVSGSTGMSLTTLPPQHQDVASFTAGCLNTVFISDLVTERGG